MRSMSFVNVGIIEPGFPARLAASGLHLGCPIGTTSFCQAHSRRAAGPSDTALDSSANKR
jgi:hypothetical protein